jgi:hypothetical protein
LRGDPRTPDELHDLLRRRGDLQKPEFDLQLAERLVRDRRAVIVRIASDERLIAAEDAGRYRDALGAMPPSGLPDVFLESGEEPLRTLVARFASRGRSPPARRQALRPGRRAGATGARARGSRPRRAGRVARSANGATRTFSAAYAVHRWPRSARRSSPPSRRRSAASCRVGTGSTGGRRSARRSYRSRDCPCRSRCGRATCCLDASLPTGPSCSTSSARPGRSSGSARVSTGSWSSSGRTPLCSAARLPRPYPRARPTTGSGRRSGRAPSSGSTCSRRPGWRPTPRFRRCGISSGPGRPPTTPGSRFGPCAGTEFRSPSGGRAGSPVRVRPS